MDMAPKFQGIRHITPAQAEHLRARIARDVDYYHRLSHRLSMWHVRDDATHAMICGVMHVRNRLNVLWRAAAAAGKGSENDQPSRDIDWQGDGI